MIYRTLGRTGLKVSQLGFGAMRLPMVGEGPAARVDRALAIPMLQRAFADGLNYVDTAVGYCNADSQRAVGEALKGYRARIVVSTKNPDYGEDESAWWKNLENSLDRLGVEFIDIYHHHGINWKAYTEKVEPRVARWMRKAVDQRLVRHIACSFHDEPAALVKLIETGYPEVLTVQYNMLDRRLEDAIALAHERGIGVVAMGPVGGGRLGMQSEVLSGLAGSRGIPELALRYVLANPHISVALSGMSAMQHVEENLATAADAITLSPADHAAIEEHLRRLQKLADLYCTGCAYCMPCEHGVDIPGIFTAYNMERVWGIRDDARRRYRGMQKKQHAADQCIECGDCEPKCPQSIAIRDQLKEAHAALADAAG